MSMVENYLVVNKYEASNLGFTDEEIENAERAEDGMIGRKPMAYVNDGTVPVYIQKRLK